jgi:hypothetical protein
MVPMVQKATKVTLAQLARKVTKEIRVILEPKVLKD